ELDYVHDNPLFELRPAEYVINVKTISALDQMTAINNAIAVDLSGQTTAESIGPSVKSAAGGQTAFAVGATMAKEGRSITVLRSTAKGGTLSNIVSIFPAGTLVTLPRNVTDIVITEWGVAHLRGKTQRQRVEELIAIAHPDFRDELRREARKLWWP
ncbi:MAG: acetyl-CoA hydrolase/transferase C-terminal domain-containing protein, partial [Candidatus Binatia bacterium]|nr:acetyl-CoA hydrolase/transferase C-terminal domain-containing protein [Candidatus Binatia bacterium]